MEEPHSGISGVIQPRALAFRKHIRYQSVANVTSKRPKNVGCFDESAGGEGQTFQADHRVPAPICEPVITGDNSSYFVSCRTCPDGFFEPACWRDDELIGC